MRRSAAWVVGVWAALGLGGCAADTDAADEEAVASTESEIRDGLPTSLGSVGGLFLEGRAYCSGTLLSPRVVLTAAHCGDAISRSTFGFTAKGSLPIQRALVHPSEDLMILELPAPGFPSARDIPVLAATAPRTGASYTIAGYGSDGTTSGVLLAGQATFTGRMLAPSETERYDVYAPRTVQVLGPWPAGVTPPPPRSTVACPGDSGGPVMRRERVSGRYRWVLYGVLHSGRHARSARTSAEACSTTSETHYVRAADHAGDIRRLVAALGG